jgi:hypothetical protein
MELFRLEPRIEEGLRHRERIGRRFGIAANHVAEIVGPG